MENDMERERFEFKIEPYEREQTGFEMEIDHSGIENKFPELGEGSDVIFVREESVHNDCSGVSKVGPFGAKKQKLKVVAESSLVEKKGVVENERKLSRQDRIELGKRFQSALSSHEWDLAESLILSADPQTLNDFLCISLDCIWFLYTYEEFHGITGIIRKIVADGAYDFTRAALRTSFLASCVSACQSRTMNLADTVTLMAQRLHERLEECNGDDVLKAEAGAKVQKFTEWALKCIGFHSRCDENRDKVHHDPAADIHLQLSAFKIFLDIAGNNLTGKDFTEAFDAACFPLTLFSSSFDPGWSCGTSASAIEGLLGMLVEGGADNVNQCFLEASRFGSTELVRILLQVKALCGVG